MLPNCDISAARGREIVRRAQRSRVGFPGGHSGAMRSIEPRILEIPGLVLADRPGMMVGLH
jgi:hypothetical protein